MNYSLVPSAVGSVLLFCCSVLSAQSPIATITCVSPSLDLPLFSDDVEAGDDSPELTLFADITHLPALLAAAKANPVYSTCNVTGGSISYSMTGVTFAYYPGVSGETAADGTSLLAAVAQLTYTTLTVDGVTVSGPSGAQQSSRSGAVPHQRRTATTTQEVAK